MRRAAHLVVIAGLALALVACDTNPRQRWVRQREALTLTQDGLVFLHRRGVLQDATFELAQPWVLAARHENWKAYFALEADPPSAAVHLDEARDLLHSARRLAMPAATPPTPTGPLFEVANYTPGQPFRLIRDVPNLQFLRRPNGDKVQGYYGTNLKAGDDLAPTLATLNLVAGTVYYGFAVTTGNGGETVKLEQNFEKVAQTPPGPVPTVGTFRTSQNSRARFTPTQGMAANKPVVIDLMGFGVAFTNTANGTTNEIHHGEWWVENGETAPQSRKRHYYGFNNPDHILFQVTDFYDKGQDLDRTAVNPREHFTWWTGTRNDQGELDLHTQRNILAMARWAKDFLGAPRVIIRGTSGGGGGAIFAALADPQLFSAVVAVVPWTIANDAKDVTGEPHMLDPVRMGLWGIESTTPIRGLSNTTVATHLNGVDRVGNAGPDLPPLVMFSSKNDPSMTWANDTLFVAKLEDTNRKFAFFWNSVANHNANNLDPDAAALISAYDAAARTADPAASFAAVVPPASFPSRTTQQFGEAKGIIKTFA